METANLLRAGHRFCRAAFGGDILFLVLCAPPLVIPRAVPEWLVAAACAGCIALIVRGAWRQRSFLSLWLLVGLILCAGLLSLVVTSDPLAGRERLGQLILGLATLTAFAFYPGRPIYDFVRAWSLLFVFGATLLGIVGPFFLEMDPRLSLFGYHPWRTRIWELPEDLHENTLASLLAVSLILIVNLLWIAAWKRRWHEVFLYSSLGGVTLTLLLATHSRGAIFSFLLSITLLLAERGGRRLALTLLTIGSLGSAGYLSHYVSFSEPGSLSTRLEIWNRSLHALGSLPFTGVGAGSFTSVVPALFPLFSFPPDGIPPHAHNLPLQVGLDLGLPGLTACFSLIFLVVICGIRGIKRFRLAGLSELRFFLSAFLLCLIGLLAHGMVDAPTWLNKPHAVMFFLAGVIVLMGSFLSRGAESSGYTAAALLTLLYWAGISLSAISLVTWSPLCALLIASLGAIWIGFQATACNENIRDPEPGAA